MEAFLISCGAVFVGEIGDKTMLLALVLATRFRKPLPLIAGILVATLFNHTLAGVLGDWLRGVVDPGWLPWLVGGSFVLVGLWALKPDTLESGEGEQLGNAFIVTTIAFFLAEIGDKTQIATTLLAARFDALLPVVGGTTLGMLLADVPVVFLGAAIAHRLPLKTIRYVAAGIFILIGISTLVWGAQG